MTWIKCSRRLPKVITEKDGGVNCVLVYAKNGFECGSDIQVWNAFYLRQRPNRRGLITHWQPLPAPPETNEKDTK